MLNLVEQLLARQVGEETGPGVGEETALGQAYSSQVPAGMPIAGRLTQSFHAGHRALDFGAPVGTPVQATMGGKVVHAGWNNQGYGNLVIIENGPYRTYFAHLSQIPVELGQTVQAGATIGLSGNTGNSTGPHLHYEIRVNGQSVDPRNFTLP
jgi:murein DD-endopeptidase MepM/ murein hydrolase activator NlpD